MRRAPPAWLVAAAGAAAYLLVDPASADLAAQEYRVGLFEREGPTIWNSGWFAGHHTPGYSVLLPPLGALLGVQLTGALAAVGAAALFARLADRHWGPDARWGALWFAAGVAALLLTGRMTFILGAAIGLGALVALQSERRFAAAALAGLTALASPVSALFVALAAVAWGLGARERRAWGAAIAVAAMAPALALAGLFPEGGDEPFVASAFWPSLAGIALLAYVLGERERALCIGAGLYAVGVALTFALSTPLGGNVTRLGALAAGPVVLAALAGRRRPAVLAALAVPLAYWQLYPPVRDVARATGDPTVHASYYDGVLRFLERGGPEGSFRVEIPMTENHWEAAHAAARVPLARGWLRQLDRKYGALFYEDELDPARYRDWLSEHAVRYVALPDADLDYAGEPEGRLLRRGLPWLRPVYRDEHWRVFAVSSPTPLLQGVPGAARITGDGFTVHARRSGDALVRVRHSRWWSVTGGAACVAEGAGGMTRIRIRAPGTVQVQATLTPNRCGE